MREREGDKMDKFDGVGAGSRTVRLAKHGVIPAQAGTHLEIGPQPQGGWTGRPGGVGRDLEMGPGLRRGDTGMGGGVELGPKSRQGIGDHDELGMQR